MLFSSRKRPHGPNVKQLRPYTIKLSGAELAFMMPDGNRTDIPEPQGSFVESVNIYQSTSNENNSTLLVNRNFNYTGFLGENLGSVEFVVLLRRIDNKDINLFDTEAFKAQLQNRLEASINEFNIEADESSQMYFSGNVEAQLINQISFIQYSTSQFDETLITSGYACPVTDDCYLDFSFRHGSVRDKNEHWHKLSQALEQKIMHSVKLDLTDSAIEKQTS